MGKRAEMEQVAIQLYAEGKEIPQISIELGVSENSLRTWKTRAGSEWDEARIVCRKAFLAGMEGVGSRLSRSRDIAARITGDAKDQGKMGLVLNQAVQTMVYDIIGQMQTVDILDVESMTATIEQMKGVALILHRSEAAASVNLKREADIRKQVLDDVVKKVDAGTAAGSPMTVDYFKQVLKESYGV
jgi:hypothetical protein